MTSRGLRWPSRAPSMRSRTTYAGSNAYFSSRLSVPTLRTTSLPLGFPSKGERLFHGRGNLLLINKSSYALFLLSGGHGSFGGADEVVAPAFQGLDVAAGGRVVPHLRVHSRSPEDLFGASEDGGRKDIVAESDGDAGHCVGGGGSYKNEVSPAGESYMLDAARLYPPGLLGVDRGSRGYGEGLFGDKVKGSFGGYHLDLVAGLAEAPDHARCFVCGDAARYSDEYLHTVLILPTISSYILAPYSLREHQEGSVSSWRTSVISSTFETTKQPQLRSRTLLARSGGSELELAK